MKITTTCRNCSHVFLSYARHCPECGTRLRRRRTERWLALGALAVSALAVAGTWLMVLKFEEEGLPPRQESAAEAKRPAPIREPESKRNQMAAHYSAIQTPH
jgi:predicted  nucleic acid-binding Zn-ribbon protein